MGAFLDIYNFLMDNQILIAVVLGLIVSLSFRGLALYRWAMRRIRNHNSTENPPEKPENPTP